MSCINHPSFVIMVSFYFNLFEFGFNVCLGNERNMVVVGVVAL